MKDISQSPVWKNMDWTKETGAFATTLVIDPSFGDTPETVMLAVGEAVFGEEDEILRTVTSDRREDGVGTVRIRVFGACRSDLRLEIDLTVGPTKAIGLLRAKRGQHDLMTRLRQQFIKMRREIPLRDEDLEEMQVLN
jgi:hypothetical protein